MTQNLDISNFWAMCARHVKLYSCMLSTSASLHFEIITGVGQEAVYFFILVWTYPGRHGFIFRFILLFCPLAMHLCCQQIGCHSDSFQRPVCSSADVLYVWGSSRVPNEDVWPSVQTAIRLPGCRNAYDFSSLYLSLVTSHPSICRPSAESFLFSRLFLSIPSSSASLTLLPWLSLSFFLPLLHMHALASSHC